LRTGALLSGNFREFWKVTAQGIYRSFRIHFC